MGISDDDTSVPSFMRNPGWEALQEEIRAGQAGKRAEDAARLDALKTQLSAVVEVGPGVSALGTPASEEELFLLHRKFHRFAAVQWLIGKPLTVTERDEIVSLWVSTDPTLDRESFLSLAAAKEAEVKRQKEQIEVIRRLMKASKVTISPRVELPETSSLGSPLADDEHSFVLNKWFFEENYRYRQYCYGMVFSEEEKRKLVWLFDEISPKSFVSVAELKTALARKFARGNGHEPISTVGERLPDVEDALLQGHPGRHTAGSAPQREAKPRSNGRKRPMDQATDDDDEFAVAGGGRSRGRKK